LTFTRSRRSSGRSAITASWITTEAMVAEVPKKNTGGASMPPGGGMGGMDL